MMFQQINQNKMALFLWHGFVTMFLLSYGAPPDAPSDAPSDGSVDYVALDSAMSTTVPLAASQSETAAASSDALLYWWDGHAYKTQEDLELAKYYTDQILLAQNDKEEFTKQTAVRLGKSLGFITNKEYLEEVRISKEHYEIHKREKSFFPKSANVPQNFPKSENLRYLSLRGRSTKPSGNTLEKDRELTR